MAPKFQKLIKTVVYVIHATYPVRVSCSSALKHLSSGIPVGYAPPCVDQWISRQRERGHGMHQFLCFCLATHILLAKAGHIASLYLIGEECVILFQTELQLRRAISNSLPLWWGPDRLGAVRELCLWVMAIEGGSPSLEPHWSHSRLLFMGLSMLFSACFFFKVSSQDKHSRLSGRTGSNSCERSCFLWRVRELDDP